MKSTTTTPFELTKPVPVTVTLPPTLTTSGEIASMTGPDPGRAITVVVVEDVVVEDAVVEDADEGRWVDERLVEVVAEFAGERCGLRAAGGDGE